MSIIRDIKDIYTLCDISFIYVSLDTTEGGCVGHWIWECALFLPHIKDIQREIPIKILLRERKQYKINILSDYGFNETDIEYSTVMIKDGPSLAEQYVSLINSNHIIYAPRFFYLWKVSINTALFFEYLNNFRQFYINNIKNIQKTIPILYIGRSKKETYPNNHRTFINMNEFQKMIDENGVTTLEVDAMNSLNPQIETVLSSKVIILEMGSAFTINAAFIASNSHIIVINDCFDYNNSILPFFTIFRKLIEERNNTVEIFSYGTHHHPFSVDLTAFNSHIKSFMYSITPAKSELKRNNCIICNNIEFETINIFPNFPIMAISNDLVKEEYYDYELISCNRCNCLQLKNLVDPSILYSDVYMNATTLSPEWNKHHDMFGKFILTNTTESSFLEIGANKGELYTIMSKERVVEYTTLDMFRHRDLPSQITFIKGNCESFNYKGFKTLILSHVFEHLYSLNNFIKNIMTTGVTDVFISIPNFDDLLKQQSMLIINSQHTYYCGYEYIVYLFSLYSYRCETSFLYDGAVKSSIFKFVLDYTSSPQSLPSTNVQLYKDIYVEKSNKFSNLEIPSNSYIIPAGIYGQLLYYLLPVKDNIIGFLDNNLSRHNNTLYGTDKKTYSPQHIDYSASTIIVCECPYKEELIAGLKSICSTVKFLYI